MIIDFGKACDAKHTYSVKAKKHKKTHIAPHLRDRPSQQSALSDVFGLGRMIKLVNSVPQL